MKFRFRAGFHGKGNSQDIGDELAVISERNNGLTAAVVVAEAKPEESPLHYCFEWSNKTAADQYRLWQARSLIRSVVIVSDDGTDSAPAYINVGFEDGRSYQPLRKVVMEPDYLRSAVSLLTSKLEQASDALATLQRAAEADVPKQRKISKIGKKVSEAANLARDLTAAE